MSRLRSQDNNGVIGLLEPMKKSVVPMELQLRSSIIKIVSGEPGACAWGMSCSHQVWSLPRCSLPPAVLRIQHPSFAAVEPRLSR